MFYSRNIGVILYQGSKAHPELEEPQTELGAGVRQSREGHVPLQSENQEKEQGTKADDRRA